MWGLRAREEMVSLERVIRGENKPVLTLQGESSGREIGLLVVTEV